MDTVGHGQDCHTRGIRACERELANLGRSVGHRGTIWQPTPSAASVGGNEKRGGSGTRGFGQFAEKPLEPGKLVTFRARVGIPHDQPQMVPSQRIADYGARRVRVDRLVRGQYFSYAYCSKTVLVLQPTFAF